MSNRLTFDNMTYEVNVRFWDTPVIELDSDEEDKIRCDVLSRNAEGTYLHISSRKPVICMVNMKKQDIVDYAKEHFNAELDISKKKAELIEDVEALQRSR